MTSTGSSKGGQKEDHVITEKTSSLESGVLLPPKNGVSYDSKKPILVNVVRVNISRSQVDEQQGASPLSGWRNIAPLIFSGSPVYQDTG